MRFVNSGKYSACIINVLGSLVREELPSWLGKAYSLYLSSVIKGIFNTLLNVRLPAWKQNFFLSLYSNSLVQLSAGSTVLFSPCPSDDSCYSRTNDSASRSHLCSFKVSMLLSPHPLWLFFSLLFRPPSFNFSNSLFICSASLLFLTMLWVKHASHSLVGRTVSTVHGNLSVMKTCKS